MPKDFEPIKYWVNSAANTLRYDDYKFKFYKKATYEYASKWMN